MIGIILLIGIVKKNAIMMIDFALAAERTGLSPRESIYQACLLRFRPIMMTTSCALLGGMPMALGYGVGSELRQPLGIAIVGGSAGEPDADAIYHTCDLSLSRPFQPSASAAKQPFSNRPGLFIPGGAAESAD